MSHKVNTNRIEPVRTRISSKKERQKSATSDIKESFKMAAKKSAENNLAASKQTEVSEQTMEQMKEQALNAMVDASTQVWPIDLPGQEITQDKHDKAVTIDAGKEEILEALKELSEKFTKLDDVVNHPKNGIGAKLVNLTLRGDNFHSVVHGATDGLVVNMDKVKQDITNQTKSLEILQQNQDRLSKMLSENKRLSSDLITAQGLIQKYSQKIKVLESKVLDLTRRGMEQNVIIHGIEEREKEEDCYRSVTNFVSSLFPFELDEYDVWKAYRIGRAKENKARPMFVKFSYWAKEKVMENVAVLKGKVNAHKQVLFISEQIPEGIAENRKALSKRVGYLKSVEEKKPTSERREVKVLGEHVLVGGEIDKQEIVTPQPFELFPSLEEQKRINAINGKIREAQPEYAKNSTFVGLAVRVQSVQDTNLAYKAVMQRFPFMDHVMLAYRFREDQDIKIGHCDDGEYGGGAAIAKFLQEQKLRNTAVFVVRRYGGIHLGFDRFKEIVKAAQKATQVLNNNSGGGNHEQ